MRAHALLILSAALLAAPPVLAQSQRTTPRGERTVEGLNNQMETQGQIRSIQQQNQFNNSQLRGEMRLQQSLPPPPSVTLPLR
ncbi:hypothetical protein OPKNFCMD_2869 [Methylobacterium crusticola]|uniref:Uncharacterized protein n=1 Tax=Methylobacterium crusticola TaxID=1697972 RepID=A0ABQ4QY79_9HYPH|nr:hypothetical protein [Methylobacterium crusticola]GJD50132.1 hypothetical protein OPKNFCMD_2869 [Methylobacterium crusticola]